MSDEEQSRGKLLRRTVHHSEGHSEHQQRKNRENQVGRPKTLRIRNGKMEFKDE